MGHTHPGHTSSHANAGVWCGREGVQLAESSSNLRKFAATLLLLLEKVVSLISGFSASALKAVMGEEVSPYLTMMEALSSKRYDPIRLVDSDANPAAEAESNA